MTLAVLALAACTPASETPSDAEPTSSAGASPSASAEHTPDPSASAALDWPDTERLDQVGSVVIDPKDGVFSSSSVLGPATVEPNRTISITGECVGTRMKYELRSSTAGEEQRVLFAGVVDCDDGSTGADYGGLAYSGPVQLAVVEATGVDYGWLQAIQERG